LSIEAFVLLLKQMARELVRALPARNLLIMNGHGGNRGVLENLMHELYCEFALNCCSVHPFDLARTDANPVEGDVHAGVAETSVMLALAPDLVRAGQSGPASQLPDRKSILALIFDRGVSFPWRSNDPRLSRDGRIGNPGAASAEIGQKIIDAVLVQIEPVLLRLLENQKVMREGHRSS
jgi:creatinine amidohydrolase/Fe(II)-dependent formamide hydrolase-like protein